MTQGNPPKWPQDRKSLLTVLWARGCIASRIAAHLCCTTNCIYGAVYRLGLPKRKPGPKISMEDVAPKESHKSHERVHGVWSPKKESTLYLLRSKDVEWSDVASRLGVSVGAAQRKYRRIKTIYTKSQ
jgi:GcrA cell cycle regulator